ncbi:hypothetical protein BJ878DRAFT_481978 [Calycina marina]|uniref:Uncharacterized protein n=1 Tax=Calycina marina TaxID=1763456 RepID=A0A9P8CEN8_9HELO|nr:hypothetical protein BJ878DRAFT_481978 [Calycina marina]
MANSRPESSLVTSSDHHGAPPRGSAKILTDSIKGIHKVRNFSDFLSCMSISRAGMSNEGYFSNLLCQCVEDSMSKSYSRWALTQAEALHRRIQEPNVHRKDRQPKPLGNILGAINFFPQRGGSSGGTHCEGNGDEPGGLGGLVKACIVRDRAVKADAEAVAEVVDIEANRDTKSTLIVSEVVYNQTAVTSPKHPKR